jgi:hypothetical protein
MGFRDSFSTLKKKVKHRLAGSKPKPKKTGADVGRERVDSMGLHPGSEPHVVAGGSHGQEGKEPSADGGQVLSTIPLPQPDEQGSVPERGSVNGDERRGTDVDGGETEQTHSRLHSVDVEVAEGSGLAERKDIDGEKVERVHPSLSTTPIPRDGRHGST